MSGSASASTQTIVAGLALIVTAIANPDGVMSTSTGKGPAVAFFRLQDAVLARLNRSRPPGSPTLSREAADPNGKPVVDEHSHV